MMLPNAASSLDIQNHDGVAHDELMTYINQYK